MQEEKKKMPNLQMKSHEALLKILNNIGIIGAILAAIADIIFVIIFVIGVKVDEELTATILFAIVNALIGVMINVCLRYQGQKYAEIENQDICAQYYDKKVKESKRFLSIGVWQIVKAVQDIIIKGCTTTFSIFGIVYISIKGSKNPIQILITLVTLVLFGCFGLMSMNSSYCRFYNIQVPYMRKAIKEKGEQQNVID